ncbi:MAG TPA: hypothetical protein VGL02_27775, partial [Streptomyces sp.]
MFRLVGRRAARTICWLRVPVLAALVAGVWVLFFASGAGARTGAYRLAILRVSYSDAATHLWTLAQYQSAATEIHDFYTRLSYGQLNMQVAVADVALRQTQGFYWNACAQSGEQRNPCPPTLIEDATQAAAAGGFSFKGVDGILVVSSFCSGDFTNGPIDIARPGVNGRFQRSYDFECALPGSLNSPGGSGVAWNGWAHEIGHQIEIQSGIRLYGNWNGHPGGYSSGYD